MWLYHKQFQHENYESFFLKIFSSTYKNQALDKNFYKNASADSKRAQLDIIFDYF